MSQESEWITDRRPTADDADYLGCVWTTHNGIVYRWSYDGVTEGTPWMPITPPEPYVKPKRWTVRYDPNVNCWAMYDRSFYRVALIELVCNSDEHREAAEEIADIYERIAP